MTTGEIIRKLRVDAGLTQEELGKKIGVQKAAINKYETGLVVNLKKSTIHALAKALNVSPVYLLGGDDNLSDEERHLVSAYRGASPEIRSAAIRMLEDSASQQSAKKQSISEKII